MPPESAYQQWVGSAGQRLAAGDSARDVLVGLLRNGVDPDTAAVAVCVAAGSTHVEAVRRLREFDGLWDMLEAGEEDIAADLLHSHRYFEPDAALDSHQQTTLANLQAVLKTIPGVPSGYAVTLYNQLRAGHLTEAFLSLERVDGQRWADNAHFWTAMHRAGQTLTPDRDDVTQAQMRCQERVARS